MLEELKCLNSSFLLTRLVVPATNAKKIAFHTMQQYNKKYNYHLIPMASMPSIIDALKNNKGNYDLNLLINFQAILLMPLKIFIRSNYSKEISWPSNLC